MGLFSGRTETTVNDPYKYMPDWQKDYFKGMTQKITENIGVGKNIRNQLMGDPEQLQNVSEQERMALDELVGAAGEADLYGDAALDLVGQVPGMSDEMMRRLSGQSAGMFDYLNAGGYGDVPTSMEDMQAYYDAFEDPYQEDVIDATLAGYDREAARSAQALNNQLTGTTGGRGSHMRLALENTMGDINRDIGRADLESGLRSDGFWKSREMGNQTAGQLFGRTMDLYGAGRDDLSFRAGQEADNIDRLFSTAGTLDDLAGSQYGRAQDLYNQRVAQGGAQRQINDVNREARRTAKKDAVSWYAGLIPNPMGGAPAVSYSEQEKPSAFGQILGTAANVAGSFIAAGSDENIKTDISIDETSALDKLAKIPTYEYRYKEGQGHRRDRTAGMMAQDVENAGITGGTFEVEGVKHVDAFPVMATIVQAVRELDARTKETA